MLQVDASDYGLGAALTQKQDGKDVAIAFASRLLSDQERKYSTTEKECLALVWGIKTFRPYVEGYHFKAVTDHQAFKWMLFIKEPSGRLGRWVLEIQQYSFDVCYRKGINNKLAGALSRIPDQTKVLQVLEIKKDEIITKNDENKVHEKSDKWYDSMLKKSGQTMLRNYAEKDGKLYRKIKPRRGPHDPATVWKLCVPNNERTMVLREIHDNPTSGHFGVRKSVARVRQSYYWPG